MMPRSHQSGGFRKLPVAISLCVCIDCSTDENLEGEGDSRPGEDAVEPIGFGPRDGDTFSERLGRRMTRPIAEQTGDAVREGVRDGMERGFDDILKGALPHVPSNFEAISEPEAKPIAEP